MVIADEAHRSQYDFIDGFARHMRDALPRAAFVGFTGTPIELQDANTRAVFGDYISIYDIQRSVEDGATVPIYFAAAGRTCSGAFVRPDAGTDPAPVPEPGHRGGTGDRGVDSVGQGTARGDARGEELGLSEDELAFYNALETNNSAVQVLGDETLRTIARELVRTVRDNVTIDWTLRENVRAHLRVLVKRTLRRYGYPPDKQEKATRTVLEQAEVLSAGWAA